MSSVKVEGSEGVQKVSFTKDTAISLGNYTFEFTATDDISSKIDIDVDGNFTITPGENNGSPDITIKRGDTSIFSNNVSIVGKIFFNTSMQSIGLADGTKISTTFGDYKVTAIADGDVAVFVAMTSRGISITPVKGDGTLNLKHAVKVIFGCQFGSFKRFVHFGRKRRTLCYQRYRVAN